MPAGKDKFGRYEKVFAEPVLTALENFIGQDEEFARAVYQNSQTFSDCLKAVVKDVGSAISDLDVYRRAVRFYFPGAEIEFCMKLHVNPYDLAGCRHRRQSEGIQGYFVI